MKRFSAYSIVLGVAWLSEACASSGGSTPAHGAGGGDQATAGGPNQSAGGSRVADFPNLTLRNVADLKIDRFGLSFHIYSNPNGEAKKWYDNVVAAKSYIGPLKAP